MKTGMFLLSLLVSSICFASGKLTLKPEQDLKTNAIKYAVGLAVHEHLYKGLYYKGWHGGGDDQEDHSKDWLKTDNAIHLYIGHVGVGMGLSYTHAAHGEWDKFVGYADASLELW